MTTTGHLSCRQTKHSMISIRIVSAVDSITFPPVDIALNQVHLVTLLVAHVTHDVPYHMHDIHYGFDSVHGTLHQLSLSI